MQAGTILRSAVVLMLAVSLLLAAGCSTAPAAGGAQLRYDGVYRSTDAHGTIDPYRNYLRFFPDGQVMVASISGAPESEFVYRWLSPDNQNHGMGRGRFKVNGNRMIFSDTQPTGMVDYDVELRGDALYFGSASHSNRYRGSVEYVFIPVAAVPQAAPAR